MPSGTLLLAGAVGALAGIAFLWVGDLGRRREVAGDGRAAARAFALFWYAIGAHTLLVAGASLSAAVDVTPTDAFAAVRYASLVLAAVALAGLSFYLLYLFTGRRGWWVPVALLYAFAALVGVASVATRGVDGVVVGRWDVDVHYARDAEPVPYVVTVLLFLLPPLVGSAAYGSLARRVEDPEQRLRILLVAGGVFAWFAGAILSRLSDHDLWLFLMRPVLGLLVAGAVVVAYRPPAWVRARLAGGRARREPLP